MYILENFNGIKNVLIQKKEEGEKDYFVFEEKNSYFISHFIVNDNKKSVNVLFDPEEKAILFEQIKSIFSDYEIINEINVKGKKQILINKGLFNLISNKENIKHNNKIYEYIPLFIQFEKEKSFRIKSNDFFTFQTEDQKNIFSVSKANNGTMTFEKALIVLNIIKEKKEKSTLRFNLFKLGISRKALKKMSLQELRDKYNELKNEIE